MITLLLAFAAGYLARMLVSRARLWPSRGIEAPRKLPLGPPMPKLAELHAKSDRKRRGVLRAVRAGDGPEAA